MRKFSLTVLAIAVLLNIYVLIRIIQEILPNYYRSDWLMILWTILPLMYLGFFFIKTFDKNFYRNFKRTINTLSTGLICSLAFFLFPWVTFYFSKETDPLGVSIASLAFGAGAVILTVIVSVIILIFELIQRGKK